MSDVNQKLIEIDRVTILDHGNDGMDYSNHRERTVDIVFSMMPISTDRKSVV